jgi:hypothetical protein
MNQSEMKSKTFLVTSYWVTRIITQSIASIILLILVADCINPFEIGGEVSLLEPLFFYPVLCVSLLFLIPYKLSFQYKLFRMRLSIYFLILFWMIYKGITAIDYNHFNGTLVVICILILATAIPPLSLYLYKITREIAADNPELYNIIRYNVGTRSVYLSIGLLIIIFIITLVYHLWFWTPP